MIKPSSLKPIISEFISYKISDVSAKLAYFIVLSIFPFLLSLVSLFGILKIDHNSAEGFFSLFFSSAVSEAIARYYQYISGFSTPDLFLFCFFLSLFTASKASNALIGSINEIYNSHLRSFIKTRLLSLACTAAISVLSLLAFICFSITERGEILLSTYAGGNLSDLIIGSKRYIIFALFFASALLIFYKLAPYPHISIINSLPGTLFCILSTFLISKGAEIYFSLSARFSVIYGSLGGAFIILLWLYLLCNLILSGALINKHFEALKKRSK